MVARTPVFYRLEKIDNSAASVGYMRLKEFNALARKDLIIGNVHLASLNIPINFSNTLQLTSLIYLL